MFFLKIFAFAVFCALFAAGCTSSGTGEGIVYAPPRADAATLAKRSGELAAALAPCEVRGLAFYPENLRKLHLDSPDEFLNLAGQFGFNRFYVCLTSPDSLEHPGLPVLLEAAERAGYPVEAVLPESNYVIGRRGNWLLKLFVPGGTTLEKMLEHIREFEAESKGFRFSGITVIAEPHLFTMSNIHRPKEQVYAWSESTYGPGLDNDMMMKLTLDKLEAFSTMLGGTPLTVAIPDFYQELAEDGKLTCGSVEDFEKFASKVMILNAGNKPTEAIEAVRNELRGARPDSLLVSVTLAEHTSVTTGALRRRNWTDFTRSLGHAISDWKQSPAFGGIVLGPFSQIETLYQEK